MECVQRDINSFVFTTNLGVNGELYDLEADPDELENLYNSPSHVQVQLQLILELKRLRNQYNDTDGPAIHIAPTDEYMFSL